MWFKTFIDTRDKCCALIRMRLALAVKYVVCSSFENAMKVCRKIFLSTIRFNSFIRRHKTRFLQLQHYHRIHTDHQPPMKM